MAQNTKKQETASSGNSLFNSWANSLDRVNTSQKELENHFLQALEKQKKTLEEITDDVARIQEEQKKYFTELREAAKLNLQNTLGSSATKVYDQWNVQFDEVTGRVAQLLETPYKESLNLLSQSQEQFQQTIKNGIDQQQKFRDEITEQIKSSQKMVFDFFEANAKLAFGLVK